MKIIIIGNSGSGKTWLATRLGTIFTTSVIHLDDLFWEPGGFDKKRCPEEIARLIQMSKNKKEWIAEGVFGELASQYFDSAELLLWLDLEWSVCKERLEKRGSESKVHLSREQSESGLRELIKWASQYYDRQDLRSFMGHKALFGNFIGKKEYLRSEREVDKFLVKAENGVEIGV